MPKWGCGVKLQELLLMLVIVPFVQTSFFSSGNL